MQQASLVAVVKAASPICMGATPALQKVRNIQEFRKLRNHTFRLDIQATNAGPNTCFYPV